MRAKELRLKIRDLKNRITGKDKVIGEYNKEKDKTTPNLRAVLV